MAHIFGSYNSRFFAVLRDGQVALHRGAATLWTRPVPGVQEVLRVGNQGDVFFRTREGVARLPHARDGVLEELASLSELLEGEEGGHLGGVRVNAEGTEICVERVTQESRLSRKLLRMLRRGESAEVEAPVEGHELFIYNRASGSFRRFFKGIVDPERKGRFFWTSSPSFAYLLVGITEKKGTVLFKIIHTREESVYSEFDMKVQAIPNLWISDNGTVLLEVRVSDQETALVVWTLEGEKFVLSPPAGSQVLHLGHRTVAMRTGTDPYLLVKSFEDTVVCHADLRPLERLGLEYEVLFNERGDMDLVTIKGEELRVNHSDTDSLAVDAKRWHLLAQQQEWAEQEEVHQQAAREREKEGKRRRQEERSRELAEAITPPPRPSPAEEAAPPRPARSRAEVEAELEKVRMHYIAGSLERSAYQEKVEELNRELAGAPPSAPIPAPDAAPGLSLERAPERLPFEVENARPKARTPSGAQVFPIHSWSGGMPQAKRLSPKEFERQKVERLLESLEERLRMGEVSEATYLELRDKYLKRLAEA